MWCYLWVRLLKTTVLFLIMMTPVKLTSSIPQNVVVNHVTTTIDISTQLVNVHYKISLISKISYLRSFIFIVDPSLVNNLSYITAAGKNIDSNIPLVNRGNGHWEIFFEYPITKHQKEKIVVFAIFTHVLKPYPAQIKQNEKHLVLYAGPISFFSPYLSLNHTSYVILGKGHIESITEPDEFTLTNMSPLTFISKSQFQPNTKSYAKIHYEQPIPFLTVRELHRTFEISHWGSIKVVEEILLDNNGAKLYGPYHRLLQNDKGTNKVKRFTTTLPASATDIMVYDDIGLVSSLTTTLKEDCIEMELYPRFELYGGWKIKYIVSYNVPSYEYLFNDDDDYVLKMRAVDHIFNDMVIDEAIIKIILPEGTGQFSLKTPFSVKRFNETYHSSYLDTIGKPVIAFSKTNVVEQHIQDFILNYKFSKLKMLFEPFYIITLTELIFILVIIIVRTDFSIAKENALDDQKVQPEVTTLVKVPNISKTKKRRH